MTCEVIQNCYSYFEVYKNKAVFRSHFPQSDRTMLPYLNLFKVRLTVRTVLAGSRHFIRNQTRHINSANGLIPSVIPKHMYMSLSFDIDLQLFTRRALEPLVSPHDNLWISSPLVYGATSPA